MVPKEKIRAPEVKSMRLRLLNLAYLFAAITAVVWVLFDLYSLLMPGGKNYPATSEVVFSSILNLLILAGGLIFLYAFYKFPESAPKSARRKSRDEVAVNRDDEPVQPI